MSVSACLFTIYIGQEYFGPKIEELTRLPMLCSEVTGSKSNLASTAMITRNFDHTMIRTDKLFKVRPIVDSLQVKFQALPKEEYLGVDEQSKLPLKKGNQASTNVQHKEIGAQSICTLRKKWASV